MKAKEKKRLAKLKEYKKESIERKKREQDGVDGTGESPRPRREGSTRREREGSGSKRRSSRRTRTTSKEQETEGTAKVCTKTTYLPHPGLYALSNLMLCLFVEKILYVWRKYQVLWIRHNNN
jgi:hypothetical protein